ncbi:YciI family protein [Croceitalea rosinachiae]|uniref:YciI family protein n=1 Tax=Croceitalea rosinachiae TaxID=3075596 RepID=A0ABU3AAY5_9FLAO|nr:YciI family protein [Croceitalea sp. F388]MDT0606076.1 YciI family protein [Croceitalea sp. F388]
MKEFMLLIRSEENPKANLSPEQMQNHIEKVGSFIKRLTNEGRMKSAQPLEMEGRILSYQNGKIVDGPYNETKEVISGYYHLLAKDLNEAIEITKGDPRFEEGIWRIEIRPIKKVEGIN